jgi:hypothetical protein
MSLELKIITALLSLLGLGAGVSLYGHHEYAKGEENMRMIVAHTIDAQNIEAAAMLAAETKKVTVATQALQDAQNKQEIQDAKNKSTIATRSDRLRAAAGPAGRLRDPNDAGCRGGGDSASSDLASATGDRAGDAAETGRLLSGQLTGLLRRLARESDDVNAAYLACRSDAYTVRGMAPP